AISCLVAGAKCVVASLHEAKDRPTSEIHARFLALLDGEGVAPHEALSRVQRDWLEDHPTGVLARYAAPQCIVAS
ncbi:MAG: hypothetical protein JWL83_4309, partial [Actinomycetia bacterium]|nr:hypothetical protein [Actinomycetes bacterium]